MAEALDVITELKEVRRFQRKAHFIAKDSNVWILDTTSDGELKCIFQIPGMENRSLNSHVGVAANGEQIIVCGERTIWQLNVQGESKKIAALDEMKPANPRTQIGKRHINWFVAAPDPNDAIFFCLLGTATGQSSFVCRYAIRTKRLDTVECSFPVGIDVAAASGIIYIPYDIPAGESPVVVAKSFDGKVDTTFQVSRCYHHCDLSEDGETLLLSQGDLDSNPAIAVLDLASGNESVFPFEGSDAAWGPNGSIFFVRGENSLWRFTPIEKEPERLFLVGKKRRRGPRDGTIAMAPVLSKDESWLCWAWAAGSSGLHPRLGKILVDLRNGEYRRLDKWWHNVEWAK